MINVCTVSQYVQPSNVAQLHGLADKPKAYRMAKLYGDRQHTAKSLIVIIACILSQYKPHVGMRKGWKSLLVQCQLLCKFSLITV
jgi:hypothetical protein